MPFSLPAPLRMCLLPALFAISLIGARGADSPAGTGSASPSPDSHAGQTVTDLDMAFDLIRRRIRNAPRVGEPAPALFLPLAGDAERFVSLHTLRRSRPVVLLFGSRSCGVFRESLGGIQELYFRFGNDVLFLFVYIREAHPMDGFEGDPDADVLDPVSFAEREALAARTREHLRIRFPAVVDSMDDATAVRWGAWPVRLFVVDTDGRIAYAGAQGPWGYRPYRGYLHGDGRYQEKSFAAEDTHESSKESLEEFLEKRFPTSR